MVSFLMLIKITFSQHTISGKVFDKVTKEPLVGVCVLIPHTLTGTTTDISGSFAIASSQPLDTIEVRYTGYKTEQYNSVPDKHFHIGLAPSATNIQEVVVTASRDAQSRAEVPLAISKISATTINDTKPTLIAELINKVSGVVMLNLNNEQHGMSIRQPMGTSNYFLYLEDGIPMRPMGVFNHNALIEMNIFAISSVEVVKGPASSLYGPEAVGGAINFITQKPTALLTAKIGVQGDNFGYKRLQYGAGGMITKKLGFYLGGFYAMQRNGWMSNSDYDKNSFNGRVDYDLTKKTKLTFAGSFNDYYSQTGGSVDSVAFYSRNYISTTDFTYRKVRSLRARVSVEHKWNENNHTTLHTFYRDNAIGQNPAYSIRWTTGKTNATGQVNVNSLTSKGFILQHGADVKPIRTKLIAGLSLDNSPNSYNAYQIDLNARLRADGLSVEQYTINQERLDIQLADYSASLLNYAAYAQAEIKPIKRLSITLGGRYDEMSFHYTNYLDVSSGKKSFEQFSPKAGVTYKIAPNAGLYANYAKGFAPPGLTSIFIKKPKTNPAEFYYNLTPAQFTNYEAGGWLSVIKNKLDLDIAIYELLGKNELLSIRQPDNSTDYQSAGKTTHQGIEYGLTYRPTLDWMIRFSGTNAVHRFDEFVLSTKSSDMVKDVNGKMMPGAPSWIANSEVVYKPTCLQGLRIGVEWQHMSAWYQDQINAVKYDDKGVFGLKGISVLNVRAGYQWRGIEVFANVMNVTNELYAFNATRGNAPSSRSTYTPAPPRTFVLGLQYNFTGKH
jgi:outer membrane receptor protein involved in Fe transport